MNPQALSSIIWSVADLLLEGYKQCECGRVIRPFTVLRRLKRALVATKSVPNGEIDIRVATPQVAAKSPEAIEA
jgi:type I restriction enzyme M protein